MAYDSSNKLKCGMGGHGGGRWGHREEVKKSLKRKRRKESKSLLRDGLQEYHEELEDSLVSLGGFPAEPSGVRSQI